MHAAFARLRSLLGEWKVYKSVVKDISRRIKESSGISGRTAHYHWISGNIYLLDDPEGCKKRVLRYFTLRGYKISSESDKVLRISW